MGGKKKPTISQLEKRMQRIQRERAKKEEKKKVKKAEMQIASTGFLTGKSLEALYKDIRRYKVITPYIVSSQFKIKMGVAKEALRRLEEQGYLKLVDKNRRVAIYVPVK